MNNPSRNEQQNKRGNSITAEDIYRSRQLQNNPAAVNQNKSAKQTRTNPVTSGNKKTTVKPAYDSISRPAKKEVRKNEPQRMQNNQTAPRKTASPRASSYVKPVYYSRPESDLKNNLKSQTPMNRRIQQKNVPSEPGQMRRKNKTQRYRIKEDNRKARKLFGNRVLAVLVCYIILLPISCGLFWLWLPHHNTPETKDYTYQIGNNKNIISKKVYPWSVVRTGDIYYLDMTGIADYCEMTTTGDAESVRYIVRASGETVEFVIDQSLCYVNGIPERMNGVSYMKNGRVYIPMDFVNYCFYGLTASVDTEKNLITVERLTDDNGNYLKLTFPFKYDVVSDLIIWEELDIDIQTMVDAQNKPAVNTPAAQG